ncbi:MATE efflux family protein [Klebsormidium nitens]|uniref:Protein DETOXIFICATION n=1 Tax=Klebsormidium nitens TaxID=105231 RepID=A0A1Y1HT27_KLENI|nr:MATE efflux family protein [Klebsormidium nitens]|eukprot:GAQ78988.1 MATE efflux family protein [Klebsormidium nitens]
MGGTARCDGGAEGESGSCSPRDAALGSGGPPGEEALGKGGLHAAAVSGAANGGPQIRTAGSLPRRPPALERAGSIHPKEEIRAETTYLELLLLAIPSMLLSGAAPLAVTVQTAMLGQKATELLAAWAVVSATTNSAVVVFNFLIVGVTAKVSLAVGAKAWRQVGARIRLALASALCAGILAAFLLAALKRPIFTIMDTNPAVQKPAEQYYFLRVLGLPSQLLAMAVVGILQGYKRVYLVATINIGRLVFEVAASYVSLFYFDWGMWGVGVSNITAVTMAFVAGLILVMTLPPQDGKGQIPLLPPEWGGCWQNCCSPGKNRPSSRFDFDDSPDPSTRLLAPEGQHFDEEKGPPSEEPRVEEHGGTWDFIWDGLSTIMRSALIQITFFLSLVCASRLGMYAVAAHQVIMQLWLITVYVVDGFANAGTIVGSDLAGRMEASRGPQALFILFELRKLTRRLLIMGNGVGFLVAIVYFFGQERIISAFTYDEGTKAQLRTVWLLLTVVQPLNATVFIYDGLIYASQSFNYMANCMFVGFIVIFLPFCGASAFYFKNLLWVWIAKAAFNLFVRFFAASHRIHFHWLRPKWAEGKDYPDEWSKHGGVYMLPAGWIDSQSRERTNAASAS